MTAVSRGQDAGTPFGSNYILSNGQYKPNGSIAGATLGMDPDSLNQWSETWDYNSRLQPRSVTVTKATTLLALQWIYSSSYNGSTFVETGQDNNRNVKFERLQYPNSGTTQTVLRTYGYDTSNRLSSYSEPGKSQSFGYDAFGNLWQSGGNSGGVPDLRATSASSYLLSTGSVSNRLAGTAYDAAGNQTQLSTITGTNATYDAENRLVKVDQSGATVVTYDYDADGRRVKRTNAGNVATWYVYDADGQLMAEYGGTGITPGTQYPITDHLGSTRLVLDGFGNCLTRMDYAPYGALVPRSGQDCYGTPTTSGMMFTGQLRDVETAGGTSTGLDYFGARFYWGSLGRFTSPDPENAGADPASPSSWNMYSYALNNPLRFTDPDGQACVEGKDEDGNACFSVTGTSSRDKYPGLTSSDEWMLRALLNAVTTTVQVGQKAQDVLQPAVDWFKRPRDSSCMAAHMGVGSSIGFFAGGGLGSLGLAGGPAAAITIPGGATGGAALGGGVGGIGGLLMCSSGIGQGGGGGSALPDASNPRDPNFRRLTVDQIKARYLRGGTELPGGYGNKTFAEVEKLARQGDRSAISLRKLLTQKEYWK